MAAVALAVVLSVLWWRWNELPEPGGQALDEVAFVGVHVVDTTTGAVVENQTLLVARNTIVEMGSSDTVTVPTGYRALRKPGRFVAPGFWDMHTHFSRIQRHYAGPMFVMHGVFYARNMSGDCVGATCVFEHDVHENRELQRRVVSGDLLAPQFVEIGSYIVRGPKGAYTDRLQYPRQPDFLVPETFDQGLALARHARSRGVDFLKPYNSLSPDAFLGLLDEAQRLGLYVGGHVPRSLTLGQALHAGLRTVEHARMLPLACSTRAEAFAKAYRAWVLAEGVEVEKPQLHLWYGDIVRFPDDDACSRVLQEWAARDAYYVPTHVTRLAEAEMASRPFQSDSRARYVPELLRDVVWEDEVAEYEALLAEHPEHARHLVEFFERGVELTGRAHAAGVKLLVGTDAGDTLIYPGASFHEEMRLYANAGLPPADILRAATLTAAEFSGLSETHGSIEPGKRADLVFLDKSPLSDITNTESIESLYVNGRYYDRAARFAVLEQVEHNSHGLGQALTIGWFVVTHVAPFLLKRRLSDRVEPYLP